MAAILGLFLGAPLALPAAALVSVNSSGTGSGNGPSRHPQATSDGQFVVFESDASNLTGNDTNGGVTDVFVRDTVFNSTTLISVNHAGGGSGNGPSVKPHISIYTFRVVFESDASDLVANDTNGHRDVFFRDLFGATTTLVSVNSSGTASANGSSHDAVISPLGRYVVFLSNATDLVAGVSDTNGADDVFIRDLQTGVTRLVSVASSGTAAGNLGSLGPLSVSDDGRYVAFTSNASDLAGTDGNGVSDVFLRDVTAGTTTLVSRSAVTSAAGNGASFGALVSRDGSTVVFTSRATDLQSGITDSNGGEDVYTWSRVFNSLQLLSQASDVPRTGNGVSTTADAGNFLSSSGGIAAFKSLATDIDRSPTYTAGKSNIIGVVRNSDGSYSGVTSSVDPTGSNAGDGDSTGPVSLSSGGDVIAYQSAATNLVAGDTNGKIDVFARLASQSANQLISRAAAGGASGNGDSTEPYVSDDGRFITFSSTASNLDSLDSNGAVQDIFIQRLCSGFLVDRLDDAVQDTGFPDQCVAVGGGCTLRAAVAAANFNGFGLICLPAGTYPLTLGTDLFVSSNVTIDGDSSANTIIDGLNTTRIFDLGTEGPVYINNVQLNNGSTSSEGGAVVVPGGTAANFTFVVFNENSCSDCSGGAIRSFAGSSLNLFGVNFNNNASRSVLGGPSINGGAIACDGLLTINFSYFNGNQAAQEGGAIFLADPQQAGNANTITETEFDGNQAGSRGGGLYVDVNAQLALANVTFGGNDSPQGSGLYNEGTLSVTNSTISGNVNAGGPGIGIGNGTVGTADLTNCTITGNSSAGAGYEIDHTGTSLTTLNTVVKGGPTRNCSHPVSSHGHNIENGSTCGFTGAGDLANTDPKLDPTLQYNGGFERTHLLLPSSPAVDAGQDAGCPPFDQRGVPRPQGAHCDMGSVEMIGMTIAGFEALEGNSGTTPFTFNVTLSAPSPFVITVQYATADGTATVADNDYLATSGTLTFGFGEQSKTITVQVVGDTKFEPDETFLVNLTNPTGGAVITRSQATGTIINDDGSNPVASIGSTTVIKPASGTVAAVFPVTLSFASASTVTLHYTTQDGTAKAGVDYQAITSILSIPPGATTASISVLVNGNTISSDDKTFFVEIFLPTNAVIGTNVAQGVIQDRSPLPSLSIGDTSVSVGPTGTAPAVFTLTLSPLSGRTIIVNYQTADGTGTAAGHDYLATSGTVFFAPGETSKTVTVTALGKASIGPRTFFVDLSPAANANVTRSRGVGTILPAYPALLAGDAAVLAPGSGSPPGTAVLLVHLSLPSLQTVTVSYSTADRTAFAGVDYTATSGSLTFAPGETVKPVSVQLLPRGAAGPTKVFTLTLSSPTNAIVSKGLGDVAIFDPSEPLPPGPFIFIDDVTVSRPSSFFAADARLSVRLTGPGAVPISVPFTTRDDSALSGRDYLSTAGTLAIAPGETLETILVPVLHVAPGGGSRTFKVSLSNPPSGAFIAAGEATVTIVGP